MFTVFIERQSTFCPLDTTIRVVADHVADHAAASAIARKHGASIMYADQFDASVRRGRALSRYVTLV